TRTVGLARIGDVARLTFIGRDGPVRRLMQTMGNQASRAFKKLEVFVAEGIQLIAVGVEHTEYVPVVVAHRHDDLRASSVKCRQMSNILSYVAHDDGFARIQCRTAQSLSSRKAGISCGVVAGFGHYHEFIFYDLVDANPAIIARGADHLHELLHSLSRAPAGQRKGTDLLKLLARGFLHSRGSNLAQKKPSASRIFNFLRPMPARR